MKTHKEYKLKEVEELDKKINVYYDLIRKGIDVSLNNDRIEKCLKEKTKYYVATS